MTAPMVLRYSLFQYILLIIFMLLMLAGVGLAHADTDSHTDSHTDKHTTNQTPHRTFMLSFDDGPLPGKTEKVLAALAQLDDPAGKPVKAAFFMVGNAPDTLFSQRKYYAPYEMWIHKGSMSKYPQLVADVRKAGHYVGCHTAHHAWFRWPWQDNSNEIKAEILAWEHDAAPLPDDAPKLFRPPYLVDTFAVQTAAHDLGYQIILGHTVGDANPVNSVADIEHNIVGIMQKAPASETPVLLIFHDIFPTADNHLVEVVHWLQQQGYVLMDFDPADIHDDDAP